MIASRLTLVIKMLPEALDKGQAGERMALRAFLFQAVGGCQRTDLAAQFPVPAAA